MARIGTSNVQDNPDMPTRDVRTCGSIANQHTDLCVFQEINPNEDLTPLRDGLGDNWSLINTGIEDVIGYDHTFARLCDQSELPDWLDPTGHFRLSVGDSDIPNPSRYYSWGCFTVIQRPHQHPWVLLDAHFTNGGWADPPKNMQHVRRQRWYNERDGVEAFVQKVHDAGLTIIFGGDWNRSPFDPFGGGRWLVQNGIDKIGCREANVNVTWQDKSVVKNPSDHDLLVTQVHFD